MPAYVPPLDDYRFLLNDVLEVDQYSSLPGFSEADADTRDAILEEAGRLTAEVLSPLNRVGDTQGCKLSPDGEVTTPDGFKDAYKQMSEGGWTGLSMAEAHGGQGLPELLSLAVAEMVAGANMAFGMYSGLSGAAVEAILAGGDESLIDLYVPKLVSGEWGGTMNLTEPQCGTDLGLIKTKAVPADDGTYKISGQKIWISAGEHDFTDNIVHLVLARLEGAPEGTKGLSLFVAPKFLPDADGNPGERNGVKCIGLEEKMGIHGNATCVMQYEGAKAWLVGEENQGLRLMFVMMNRARLGTGLQGLALASAAYSGAAEFANDRLQGRALTGPKAPEKPADPIIVHPDVRRMLMEQRAFVEAARAFVMYVGLQADLEEKAEDDAVKQKASDYLALLTPVVKSYLTSQGFENVSNAVQVFGGAGYVEETGMAQILRDARIPMIYEGANGIQALDLVGRKLAMESGRPIMTFLGEIDAFMADTADIDGMAPFNEGLKTLRGQMDEALGWLMEHGLKDPNEAAGASHDFLQLMGVTCLAYMWAMMAKAALPKADSDAFHAAKLTTARYYYARKLPEASAHLAKVKAGAETLMALDAGQF